MAMNKDLSAGRWTGPVSEARWEHVLRAANKSSAMITWCQQRNLSLETGLPLPPVGPAPAAPAAGPAYATVVLDSARFQPRAEAISHSHWSTQDGQVPWAKQYSVLLTGTSLDLDPDELTEALQSMMPPVLLSCKPRKCAATQRGTPSGVFLLSLIDDLSMLSLCMNLHGKVGTWPRGQQGAFIRVHLNIMNDLAMDVGYPLDMTGRTVLGWDIYASWGQALQKPFARNWLVNQYGFSTFTWPGHGGWITGRALWPARLGGPAVGPAPPPQAAAPPPCAGPAGPPAGLQQPAPGPGGVVLRGEAFQQQRAGVLPAFKAAPPGDAMRPPALAPGKAPPLPPGTGPAVRQQAPAPVLAPEPAPATTADWAVGWQGWDWQGGWARDWQGGWARGWHWQPQQSWGAGWHWQPQQAGPASAEPRFEPAFAETGSASAGTGPAAPQHAPEPGPASADTGSAVTQQALQDQLDPFVEFPLHSLVTLVNLQRSEVNGAQGTVMGYSNFRYRVKVEGHENEMAVRRDNLVQAIVNPPVDLPAAPGPASAAAPGPAATAKTAPRFKQPPDYLYASGAAAAAPKQAVVAGTKQYAVGSSKQRWKSMSPAETFTSADPGSAAGSADRRVVSDAGSAAGPAAGPAERPVDPGFAAGPGEGTAVPGEADGRLQDGEEEDLWS